MSARPVQRSSARSFASTTYSFASHAARDGAVLITPCRDFLRASLGRGFRVHAGGAAAGCGRLAEAQQQRVAAAAFAVGGCRSCRCGGGPGPISEPGGRAVAERARSASRCRAGAGVRRQRRRPGARLLLSCLRLAWGRGGAHRARATRCSRSSPRCSRSRDDRGRGRAGRFTARGLRTASGRRCAFVVNPNSPTGHWIPPADARGAAARRKRSRRDRRGVLRFRPGLVRSDCLRRTRTGSWSGPCRSRMRLPAFASDMRLAPHR